MTETYDILTNFSTAFYSKFTAVDGDGAHNAFYNAINGQMFEDDVEAGMPFPYAVYNLGFKTRDKTFTETFDNILMQLSIFSTASGTGEIKNLYALAQNLFDECKLTITGSRLLRMYETGLSTNIDTVDSTVTGTQKIRHYAIDFEINTLLN